MPHQTPYLDNIRSLASRYPCLQQLFKDWSRFSPRSLLAHPYHGTEGVTGRAGVIEFIDGRQPQYQDLSHIEDLTNYLSDAKESSSSPELPPCVLINRLYILEDLLPPYVEALGAALDIDPVVFANHLNTYHYNSTNVIPQRTLPSLLDPTRSFTLRYYELRKTLARPPDGSVSSGSRRTFAHVSRQIESSTRVSDSRASISLVRRNSSFWCRERHDGRGWDAILLLDPPLDSHPAENHPPCSCYILRQTSKTSWIKEVHSSVPYHGGYGDIRPWDTPSHRSSAPSRRSLFDDIVFYWEHAEPAQIQCAMRNGVDTTMFLTRIIASQWSNLLELQLETLSSVEILSRNEGHPLGEFTSSEQWRTELLGLGPRWKDLNVFRARLMWYEDEMLLNLERLGIAADGATDPEVLARSASLRAARKDFYAAFVRLQLYKSRADSLTGIISDLVNLRGALRSLDVGHFGLKLTILGAVFFPVTLVATLFSMGDNYKPGARQFWIPWAVAVPLVIMMGVYLSLPGWPRHSARKK